MENFNIDKKSVAVIGATGQIGTVLTKGLLKLGHEVTALTREINNSNKNKLELFKKKGAKVTVCKDMSNSNSVAQAIEGCEILIVATPGSKYNIEVLEPIWLEAAVKANIKRFVPTEFGAHTQGLDMG